MKKYSIFLIVLVLVAGGCSKVKIIPEISPHLSEIHVLDLTDKNLSKTLVENNSELVFTTLEGKLFRWDPEKKMVNFLYSLNSGIQPDIFSQGSTLILEQLKPGQYTIFDLNEMKEVASLQNRKMERILGLDHQLVVYLANKEIHIYNYRSDQLLKSLKIAKRKDYDVYNSEFRGNSLFILSSRYLYIYDKGSDVVERIELKRLAASGFLLDGDVMYYGSSQRELVKFSIESRKVDWAFKIPEALKIKPDKIGPYVVIIPEDNNIYFFNTNGTLYWWEKLNSTRLMPPVPMKENVVVFLWDKKIKFFNYKKKQVTTYPLNRKVRTNLVCIGDYIYVVSEVKPDEENQEEEIPGPLQLSKIGNHYGVEITSEPQYVKPMGKSIRFNFQAVNLVEPQFKIKILKNQPGIEIPVYDKILTVDDKPSFVWIPGEVAEYRMIVEVEAENKKGLTVEERFKTVDVEEILRNYYYQLHSRCDSNSFN